MLYRGREGQWSFIAHRLTGTGVLLFLFIHILDTFLVAFGPSVYNHVIALYRAPLFRWGEVALFGCVLYHALNGVRIILVDVWPGASLYHRPMFYIEMAIFIPTFLGGAWVMLKPLFL